MSMTRQHARSLLDAFSPPGETWRSDMWVAHSLSRLCDAAAETGFSEYYYYSSWVLGALRRGENGTAMVRTARGTCARTPRDAIRALCTADPSSHSRIASWATQTLGRHLYVVLENHASRANASDVRAGPVHSAMLVQMSAVERSLWIVWIAGAGLGLCVTLWRERDMRWA